MAISENLKKMGQVLKGIETSNIVLFKTYKKYIYIQWTEKGLQTFFWDGFNINFCLL